MINSMWTSLSFCYVFLNSPRLNIKQERDNEQSSGKEANEVQTNWHVARAADRAFLINSYGS